MKQKLVIYDKHDNDGWLSAWICHSKFGDKAEYLGLNPGDPAPPAEIARDREVYILDMAFEEEGLRALIQACKALVLLDHHETAQKRLAGLIRETRTNATVHVVFDVTHSACALTWEWLFPGKEATWLVRYVEDRDLWKHQLKDSQAINAALSAYKHDFLVWDNLSGTQAWQHVEAGEAILQYQEREIERLMRQVRNVIVAGYTVPCVNTAVCISEIGHRLALLRPEYFGATYYDAADDTRRWSLRSTEGGMDVGAIARSLGGGGHRHAAGLSQDLSRAIPVVVSSIR